MKKIVLSDISRSKPSSWKCFAYSIVGALATVVLMIVIAATGS